eukprot:Colp12_sorted_trinity150504_noHs@22576
MMDESTKESLLQKIAHYEKLLAACTHCAAKLAPKNEPTEKRDQKKKKKEFDFSKHPQRHIALKIAYMGWDYYGLACQENVAQTIEEELFKALTKACLVKDRASSNYSRCGRTDKGVSALGQVISLNVRSKVKSPNGSDGPLIDSNEEEIDYVGILNRILPDTIRVLAWAPVPEDFDARFSTLHRTYKYYFIKRDLDIEGMRRAAQGYVGEHDFRNLCKMDINNGVTNYVRTILAFDVDPVDPDAPDGPESLWAFTITGFAFLWHQVRCMVAVLFLVGSRLELPDVVPQLLDVERCPRKPQYTMASELPLVLHTCGYEQLHWSHPKHAVARVHEVCTRAEEELRLKAAVLRGVITYTAHHCPTAATIPSAGGEMEGTGAGSGAK